MRNSPDLVSGLHESQAVPKRAVSVDAPGVAPNAQKNVQQADNRLLVQAVSMRSPQLAAGLYYQQLYVGPALC